MMSLGVMEQYGGERVIRLAIPFQGFKAIRVVNAHFIDGAIAPHFFINRRSQSLSECDN